MDLAAAKAHAQWWFPEFKPKLETNPSAAVEGVDGAISARVADECNRILRQDVAPGGEERHPNLVTAGKQRGLAAWGKFDVFSPHGASKVQKRIVHTRRAPTWKMVEGKKCVKARLLAEGFQGPD